jgi:LacI family transcriptional regulator
MSKPKRVVIVHASDASMDLVLAGISEARRDGCDWSVRHQYQAPRNQQEIAELQAYRPDGILSVSSNLPPALLRLGIPWVSLRSRQSPLAVMADDQAVGQCAADHLIGLGMPTLAHLAHGDSGWQVSRGEGFLAGATRHGRSVVRLEWNGPEGFLAQLAPLPRPLALFTGNDWFALEVMEALLSLDTRIPAEVALLGADDLPACATATVPLSSVRVPHRECGRRAAHLLGEAMSGRCLSPVTIMVAPEGVAERASTDALAIRDPEVAAMLRLIRMRIGEPFTVGDIVTASSLGRRSLEIRFRRQVGHTILEEIHRCRITQAKAMLRASAAHISDIAAACGFSDASQFAVVFRKLEGMAPGAWRTRQQDG